MYLSNLVKTKEVDKLKAHTHGKSYDTKYMRKIQCGKNLNENSY